MPKNNNEGPRQDQQPESRKENSLVNWFKSLNTDEWKRRVLNTPLENLDYPDPYKEYMLQEATEKKFKECLAELTATMSDDEAIEVIAELMAMRKILADPKKTISENPN